MQTAYDNSDRQIAQAEARHRGYPGPIDDAIKAYKAARTRYITAEAYAENCSESRHPAAQRAENAAYRQMDAALDALLLVLPLTGDQLSEIDSDVRDEWRATREARAALRGEA